MDRLLAIDIYVFLRERRDARGTVLRSGEILTT